MVWFTIMFAALGINPITNFVQSNKQFVKRTLRSALITKYERFFFDYKKDTWTVRVTGTPTFLKAIIFTEDLTT